MTLFKQMAIAVSLIIITMLGAVMLINYQTTKEDMIQNVYQSSVNNIGSLAHTLSQTQGDEAYITTNIDAAFGSGYYRLIEYVSSDGEFRYKQEFRENYSDVPSWFVAFANIELAPLEERVTLGWETLGSLKVAGDLSVVYKSLYETFTKLIYLFFIFTAISLFLLSVLLSFLLKPLKEVQKQAEAILKDEFVFQEKMPYTTEFKEVVRGMNLMVKKVEYIFIKGSETLKRNKELLYVDQTTELYNRRYLLLRLPDILALQNRQSGGNILLMGLKGGELLNKQLGRQKTDRLFYKIGAILTKESEAYEEALAVRMNATEFTLVLPDSSASAALEVAKKIHVAYEELLATNEVNKDGIALDIGIYKYKTECNISDLLMHADSALAHAKADEQSSIYLHEHRDDACAMGKEQWREIIESSIENQDVVLKFWPAIESKAREIEHNVMTFNLRDRSGTNYFYGDFIAPAIELGLVSRVYMAALKRLFVDEQSSETKRLCSVRLSSEFIKDPNSFEVLSTLLAEHAKGSGLNLVFELSDNLIIKNPMLVRRFIELFKLHGYGFGINAFTGEAESFEYLRFLNPRFIKADVSFLADQSKDSMSALQIVTDSIGVKIIASSVKSQEELDALYELEIFRVQGPITEKLK